MTQHNFVSIRGRLTSDPKVVELENSEISSFTIANNRDFYNKSTEEKREEVYFFDCKAFGSLAKLSNKFLKKGRDVLVTGYLKQEKWQDKETKENRSKLVIQLDNFEFLDSVSGNKNDESDKEDKEEREEKVEDNKSSRKKRPF